MALRPIPLAVSQGTPAGTVDEGYFRHHAHHSRLYNMVALPNPPGARSPHTLQPTPSYIRTSAPAVSFTEQPTFLFTVPGSSYLWALTNGAAGASRVRNSNGFNVALPAGLTYAFKCVANATHILVIGVAGIACVDIAGASATAIATGWNATDVAWQDGYGIVTRESTGRFYITGLNDLTTIGALDFATAESNGDYLVGCCSYNRELWLFGERSIEVWQNTGSASFPFERVQTNLSLGCIPRTNIVAGKHIAWVGNDRVVYVADGYTPRALSHGGVHSGISGAMTATTGNWPSVCHYRAFGFDYFAVMPKRETDGVYHCNLDTGQWHSSTERAIISTEAPDRTWMFAALDVVPATVSPYVLRLTEGGSVSDSFTAGTSGTDVIERYADLPLLHNGTRRAVLRQLALDILVRVGGAYVYVWFLDDVDNNTYATFVTTSATTALGGIAGMARHSLWRLGSFRQRMIRIRQASGGYNAGTHNPLVISGVYVDVEEMAS